MYAAMVAERGDQEFSLVHRSCQYDTLFRIASLTKTGNPNADVVWEDESAAGLDTKMANVQSVLWRKQLELLGNADGSDQLNHLEQAAAAGTLQFQDITLEEKSIFEDQEKWLDNIKLQREDQDEAYTGLEITDRGRPHIAGMSHRTILKFWQVTAIWALYKFHTGQLKGGVLADAVGLGKTIVALGLLQFKYNLRMKANTIREITRRYGAPKPTMVVVPPTLLHQWVEMIREHLPDFILLSIMGTIPTLPKTGRRNLSTVAYTKDGSKTTKELQKRLFSPHTRLWPGDMVQLFYRKSVRRKLIRPTVDKLQSLNPSGQYRTWPGTATSKNVLAISFSMKHMLSRVDMQVTHILH